MKSRNAWVHVCLIVGAASACSLSGGTAASPGEDACGPVFVVENSTAEAVEIFLQDRLRVRLGAVPAFTSAHLTSVTQPRTSGTLRLVVRRVSGGPSVTSDELWIGPGDQVRWKILEPLRFSSISATVVRGTAC